MTPVYAPPQTCACGLGHDATPWHCSCQRWKPATWHACEVCLNLVDEPADALPHRVRQRALYHRYRQHTVLAARRALDQYFEDVS